MTAPITSIPAPSPSPSPIDTGEMAGAEALKDAVADKSNTVAGIIEQLDAYGFTVESMRFSVWSVLVVVMVVAGVIIFARLTTHLANKGVRRASRLDTSQQLLIEKLISIAVWVIALLFGIDLLGIDLTALTVFSGAFGLAIGFGLQKTFGNLIAGIILLMDRSIKPGDVIAIADQSGQQTFGQIRKIGIRAVSIITRDEREYLIPNENLMINQVENWSYSSRRVRIQVPVGVAYDSDMDLVQKLLLEAAAAVPRVMNDPAPSVWMAGFGESSVNFAVHCWILDPEEGVGNVKSDVLKQVWRLFQDNGIEIPFPQRDLNLRDNAQFKALLAALAERQDRR
jgi:small-conductance mechanosensitive channel